MRFLRRPASVRCPGAPHRAAVAFLFALFLAASCASFDADARAQSLPTDVKPSNGSTVSQQSALSTPSGPSSASASAPLAEDDPEPRPAVAALPRHVFSENEAEPEEGRTGDTPTLVFGVPTSVSGCRRRTNRGSGKNCSFPPTKRFGAPFPTTGSSGGR